LFLKISKYLFKTLLNLRVFVTINGKKVECYDKAFLSRRVAGTARLNTKGKE